MASAAPPGRIRLKVQDTDGQAVANARVSIEASTVPVPDIAALSNDEGEVVFSLPSAGCYSFSCVADGFAAARREIDTTDEAQETVIMELVPDHPESRRQ